RARRDERSDRRRHARPDRPRALPARLGRGEGGPPSAVLGHGRARTWRDTAVPPRAVPDRFLRWLARGAATGERAACPRWRRDLDARDPAARDGAAGAFRRGRAESDPDAERMGRAAPLWHEDIDLRDDGNP